LWAHGRAAPLLIKPIIDKVLRPKAAGKVLVSTLPHTTDRLIDLQFIIPQPFSQCVDRGCGALVVSAIVKSICDYLGTLLANKAGFGMITDLRNDLYDSILRRSGFLPAPHDGHVDLDARQRRGAGADRHGDHPERFSAAILHPAGDDRWSASAARWRGCCCCLSRW
jgi:hypothetical protein